ncbi:hypothetical protein BGX29_002646 [Mortierella sp. GBA35]|nr:hypothetical protein BGX23_012475 [Mortierella sp. AD031]KAF9103968.1 hypothetical protein BGX29_002646 [Mortierella sp. GBA35]KAG0211158.1 hypothetical protein BGX33_004483 [Mortierella sp. NVP41]
MSVRIASHAGSWYSASGNELDRQLEGWLAKAGQEASSGPDPFPIKGLRAIIAPHAGYSYSGPAAGFAYKTIQPELFKRVFILGPSHHVYLRGCALSKCIRCETPLGELTIDQEVNKELQKTGEFETMARDTDEDEHSIEMHLPYVYKVFEDHIDEIKIVPILVGALNKTSEQNYGKLLAPYLNDPQNLFIISSDFCHWGTRFDYTYYADDKSSSDSDSPVVIESLAPRKGGKKNYAPPEGSLKIYESIERLDREGMETIEKRDHAEFCQYLSRTKNTICGRHPIGVLLAALEHQQQQRTKQAKGQGQGQDKLHRIRFVHYSQSSHVLTTLDSSVSYASAFVQQK